MISHHLPHHDIMSPVTACLDTAYLKYFDWQIRNNYDMFIGGTIDSLSKQGFCGLCGELHEMTIRNKIFQPVEDLSTWWFGERNKLSEKVCEF